MPHFKVNRLFKTPPLKKRNTHFTYSRGISCLATEEVSIRSPAKKMLIMEQSPTILIPLWIPTFRFPILLERASQLRRGTRICPSGRPEFICTSILVSYWKVFVFLQGILTAFTKSIVLESCLKIVIAGSRRLCHIWNACSIPPSLSLLQTESFIDISRCVIRSVPMSLRARLWKRAEGKAKITRISTRVISFNLQKKRE